MRGFCGRPISVRTLSALLAAATGSVVLDAPAEAVDRTFNVSLVSSYNPPIGAINNHYADLARQGDIVALGSVAGDGVAFVSIANPAAPSFLSYYNPAGSAGGHFQDIEFKGNYAFCALDDAGSANGGIHVVNIANPAAPVKVAEITNALSGFSRNHTIFLDGDFLYAASNQISTVKVFNVANPATPTFVRDIVTTGPAGDNLHQITVSSGRLYTSNITNGRQEIYDISDVASPSWTAASRLLGSFVTPTTPGVSAGRNHSSWPSEDGNLLAICRETLGGDVQIWNIANPAAPTMLSRIDASIAGIDGLTPHNPVIVGDTLYVTWYQAGLQIFNIRNPANPVHLGAYDTFVGGYPGPSPYLNAYDGNWGLDVSLGVDKILLSNMDDGLHIVNATNAFRKAWTHAGDATWQQNSRWSGDEGGGPFPDSSEMIASFTNPAAGAVRTVTVDGGLLPHKPRVAAIEFSSSLAYTINAANGGAIDMNSSSGPARISTLGAVAGGVNRINAPLELSDDLLVTNEGTSSGVSLALGAVVGAGRTMTFQGVGETALTAASPSFSGSVIVAGGKLRLTSGLAVNGAPITLAGGTLALRNDTATNFFSNVSATDNASLIIGNDGGGSGQVHAISNLTVAAGKTLALSRDNSTGIGVVNVLLNGTLAVAPGGASATALKFNTLSAPPGKLDLADAKLVVSSTPIGTWTGSSYSFLTGWIATGRNGGAWNGSGIVTSHTDAINNNDLVTIGVASASQVTGIAATATTTWAGQTVTGTDTLTMVTWGGDANLDGRINIDDYGRIDGNVSSSGSVFGWFNGDFNYDGKINIDDYGIIDGNINRQGAPFGAGSLASVVAVPEPVAGTTVIVFTAVVAMRRRRMW